MERHYSRFDQQREPEPFVAAERQQRPEGRLDHGFRFERGLPVVIDQRAGRNLLAARLADGQPGGEGVDADIGNWNMTD